MVLRDVSKMRKHSKTSSISSVIVWVLSFQGIAGVAVTTFPCAKKAELNESFNITCSITGTIVNGIQWTRPDDTIVTACSNATTCFTFLSGYIITKATSSENVLNISSVGKTDFGKWTCYDGAGGDKGCEIIVQKTPNYELTLISTQPTYSVGDTLEVSVDVQDYYCSRTPSFHLLLDSQRVELDALPSTSSTIHSGKQNKSINVTEEMTGSIKLVFNCRNDDVLVEKTFDIPASDCSIIVTIVMIIIIVIKVLAFIILLIAIFCWKEKLHVIQGLYVVDVTVAVAAIIGGIVCLAVTVTELTTREGSICNTSIGLSSTCLVIGLLNPVFIIFFLGSLMDMAGVQNNPLAGHFCAFPRKNVDKPRRGENSPTTATVVDIGVTNSGNSRGNGNHGKILPKSKTTNGPKASSLGTHERKNEDKVDDTNIRGLSLQPILSNEKGDGHNGQTNNNTNSKLETDNGEKKKGSKKKKKTKKKPSEENGDGSRRPPTVSVSAVDVDDQKTAGKPEEQTGSLSKLTVVESSE